MGFEPFQFVGVPDYGVKVAHPVGDTSIAIIDFADRPRDQLIPESPQLGKLTAYLCGAGARAMVYDFQHRDPVEAADWATGLAVHMKGFAAIDFQFVGLEMDKVPQDHGMVGTWGRILTEKNRGSIEDAIRDIQTERQARDLPV